MLDSLKAARKHGRDIGLVGGAHDDSSEGVKILAQLRETYIAV